MLGIWLSKRAKKRYHNPSQTRNIIQKIEKALNVPGQTVGSNSGYTWKV